MRTLLLLTLAGCGGCDSRPDPWGYGAVLDPGPDPAWEDTVQHAADNWNLVLSDACGSPALSLGRPGHPVIVVPLGTDLGSDVGGRFTGDDICIIPDLGSWEDGVLTHEMGHALGMEHVPESVDPYSIMNPALGPGETISPGDALRARRLFGCR